MMNWDDVELRRVQQLIETQVDNDALTHAV